MKHTIPTGNWALADAIESAQSGDVVKVHSVDMQELAERMCQRRHPDKNLVFEVQAPPTCRMCGYDPRT